MENKKQLLVQFEDQSAKATGKKHDGIEFSFTGDESLRSFEVNGVPFVSGNGPGLIKLGEILIQLGLSEYASGFHIHINEDFDGERKEILVLGVNRSDATQ